MTDDAPRPQQPGNPTAPPDPSWAATGQTGSRWSPAQQPASESNRSYGSPLPDGSPTDVWPAPAGVTPPPTAPIGLPSPGVPGPRRRPVMGAVLLSLVVGLVAGTVGGAVGYQLAGRGPA